MSTLSRFKRALFGRGSGPVILMYHRVAEVTFDPWGLCVSPRSFAEQLQVLRQQRHVVHLRDLVRSVMDGTVRQDAVAVTFDDGYADNLTAAKPLLEQADTPATVFLTSGVVVGGEREFWWDELDRLLVTPETLPEVLCLTVGGRVRRWRIGEERNDREEVYRIIWRLLRPLPHDERQVLLDEVAAWAGLGRCARRTHRPLSQDEVRRLADGDLIEIGAHTVTHPVLPAMPVNRRQAEIGQSKIDLEAVVERRIVSFSYPFGAYTGETARMVREAGFACACTTTHGSVERSGDVLRLPRVAMENWTGEQFARRLNGLQ